MFEHSQSVKEHFVQNDCIIESNGQYAVYDPFTVLNAIQNSNHLIGDKMRFSIHLLAVILSLNEKLKMSSESGISSEIVLFGDVDGIFVLLLIDCLVIEHRRSNGLKLREREFSVFPESINSILCAVNVVGRNGDNLQILIFFSSEIRFPDLQNQKRPQFLVVIAIVIVVVVVRPRRWW